MTNLSELVMELTKDGYTVDVYPDSVDVTVLTPGNEIEGTEDMETHLSITYDSNTGEFEGDSELGSVTFRDEYDIKYYINTLENALVDD